MEFSPEQYLGPVGLTAFVITALVVVWKNFITQVKDIRTDLEECHKQHEETKTVLVEIVKENATLRGKVEVLEKLSMRSEELAMIIAKELKKFLNERDKT